MEKEARDVIISHLGKMRGRITCDALQESSKDAPLPICFIAKGD